MVTHKRRHRLALALRRPLDLMQLPGTARVVNRLLADAAGTTDVRLWTGVRLRVDLEDRVQRLCAFRAYERKELALMRSLLRSGDIVLDIGAHTGYYALHAALRIGATGEVHAFEPVPTNAERIRENALLNGLKNIRVVQAAVSNRTGTAAFTIVDAPGESGWGSLIVDPGPQKHQVQVPVTIVDDYVRHTGLNRVSFVKLDVQGGEFEALEGAAATLKEFAPVVLCELVDVYWGKRQVHTTADVMKFMESLGFTAKPLAGKWRRSTMNFLFRRLA